MPQATVVCVVVLLFNHDANINIFTVVAFILKFQHLSTVFALNTTANDGSKAVRRVFNVRSTPFGLRSTAGHRLTYTKHYISDYIIKKGKSKKKRRKQKKAARAVNTLMTIIRVRRVTFRCKQFHLPRSGLLCITNFPGELDMQLLTARHLLWWRRFGEGFVQSVT